MKKRILSLALALILVISVVTVPVQAATGKDVFNYLKDIAMNGDYDSDANWWYNSFQVDDNFWYGVFYLVGENYIEASIFSNYYEVTWRISSNPSPSYNAFMKVYDEQNTKGTVAIAANYNGAAYSSFKNFSGDTSLRAAMLQVLNNLLPAVVEFTRAVINENDYSLRDLGLTAYNKCDYAHAFDHGVVTQEPNCVNQGVMIYTCRVCAETYTEYLSPTGVHTWDQGTVITQPTCTEPGLLRYACAVCGAAGDEEAIPALGHVWTYAGTVEQAPENGHGMALYRCIRCDATKEDLRCASVIFEDMPAEGNWAHAPIDWAYFNGITSGKTPTTFAPKDTVTRAEAMTFLWKTLGSPMPETTENPFEDVKEGKYYYYPVLWAVENEITSGTSDTTFGPKEPCTRAQILTFIWIAAGRPEPETTENPFTDVKEGKYYYKAVLWGVENHITSGIAPDEFGTKNTCTRAQIVAFLYKAKDLMHEQEPDTWSVIGWICGTTWDVDFPMKETEENVFESEGLQLHAGDEFKVRANNSWDVNFGANGWGGDNYEVHEDGAYIVRLDLNNETLSLIKQ